MTVFLNYFPLQKSFQMKSSFALLLFTFNTFEMALLLLGLVECRWLLLRFHRPELVSQYFDRIHCMVVYHFHKRYPEMLPDSLCFFFPANASSVANAVAPISIAATAAITTMYLVFI
jgi:hypothetical protein